MEYFILLCTPMKCPFSTKSLSQCNNAVATFYKSYDSGASCGLGFPKIYGAALDDKIYKHRKKCWIR